MRPVPRSPFLLAAIRGYFFARLDSFLLVVALHYYLGWRIDSGRVSCWRGGRGPCPWLGGWEEGKVVLWGSSIHLLTLLEEHRAHPAPAHVVVHLARDAVSLLLVGAVLHPVVVSSASSTGVILCCAFPGDMVPVVAFHTSNWLFLQFGYPNAAVADMEACNNCSVSIIHIQEREDEMCCSLVCSVSTVEGFHPSHSDKASILDVICFRDLF